MDGFLISRLETAVAELNEEEYPGGGAVCAIRVHFELLGGEDVGPDTPPPDPKVLIVHRVLLPGFIQDLRKVLGFLEEEDRDPEIVPLDLPWSQDIADLNEAVVNEIADHDKTEGW